MTVLDESVALAVATLQSMIDADGFLITASAVDDTSLDLTVSAKPEACADCLVPKPMMIDIANAQLAGTGHHVRTLRYPTD